MSFRDYTVWRQRQEEEEKMSEKSLVERLDINKAELRLGLRRALQRIEELEAENQSYQRSSDDLYDDLQSMRAQRDEAEAENARLREENERLLADVQRGYPTAFRVPGNLLVRAEEMVEELEFHARVGYHAQLTIRAADLIRELAGLEKPESPKVTTSPNGVRQTTPSEILKSQKGREAVEKTAGLGKDA